MFEVSVRSSFSGAHRLKGYRGKCEALHGHNWDVEAFASAKKLDAGGLSIDFKVLRNKLNGILDTLDHRDLNGVVFFKKSNPSAENIARYIYISLKKALKGERVSLRRVSVRETRDSRATYYE
jgi:6-pyruvoyltetrahydropterin/6-carboxytetrahydropterin synthase